MNVYAPGGVRSAVQAAAAAFERETGQAIAFTFDTGGGIQKRVAAGEPADVVVLPSTGAAELERLGIAVAGSRQEVGSVGVGVGIQAGARRPAIATVQELRDTLLAARSVAYADPARGATSGAYFASVVLPRLGIVEAVRAKTVLTAVGEDAVRRVARGESELVVVQSSEITAVPGAELAGPLPAEIQKAIAYAAVVVKSSRVPAVAGAFARHLASPAGRRAFEAAGFAPPSPA
jgi:molybdate transport system substrate-binding protein